MNKFKLPLGLIFYFLIYFLIIIIGTNKQFLKRHLDFFILLNIFLPFFIFVFIDTVNKKLNKFLDFFILLSLILLFVPFKIINFKIFLMDIIFFIFVICIKKIILQNIKDIEIQEYEISKDEEAIENIEKQKIAYLRKNNEEIELEVKDITSLYTAVKDLSNTIRIEDTINTIWEILKKLFKNNLNIQIDDIFFILIIRKDTDFVIAESRGFEYSIIKENEKNIAQTILKNIVPGKELIYYPTINNEIVSGYLSFIKSILYLPLYAEKKLLGVIFLGSSKENIFSKSQLEYFKILSSQFAIALEKAYLYEEVEQMSITDSLTGLYVHRYFQDKLEYEINRAARYEKGLSLIIADIDYFKKINDTYGHLAGDYILKTLALIFKNNTTPVDTVARYGGEEFVIILPDTNKDKAHLLGVKIRKEVENYKFRFQNFDIKVTISMGVASYPQDALNRRELIEKADKALYQAKQEGRNRVIKYQEKL